MLIDAIEHIQKIMPAAGGADLIAFALLWQQLKTMSRDIAAMRSKFERRSTRRKAK